MQQDIPRPTSLRTSSLPSYSQPSPTPSHWRRLVGWLLLLLLVMTFAPATAAPLATVPANFVDDLVTSVGAPTALAFTPDGRLLITTQGGQLRLYQNGALLTTPALTLTSRLCSNFERGLLGVAVDPDFASNSYIYLFYTFNKFNSCPRDQPTSALNPVNRVARFILPANNVIAPTSEMVLVDNIPSKNGNHNGGDLHFGSDGLLYISVGDSGALSTNTTQLSHLAGKILRVQRDGTFPPANPYATSNGVRRCGDPAGLPTGSGACGEIFASGLRNPFRITFRPGTSQFYINDVGQSLWEEIDEGIAGADYGWCQREGPAAYSTIGNCQRATGATLTEPIFAYNHNTGCSAITAGVFVPQGLWPAPYAGAYLFADYGCGKVLRLIPGNPNSSADFATGLADNSVTTMIFGPHGATQALYYLSYANGGQVRRISYSGVANRPPVAVINASPTSGSAPLTVTFSGAGSSDPDASDSLTYIWDFGDGTTTNGAPNAATSHTYAANGLYQATLTVLDNQGALSAPVSQRIDVGNLPPTVTILSPMLNAQFAVNDTLLLQGSAQDNEEGQLADSALTWQVFLHHVDENNPNNAHTHPILQPTTGNNLTLSAPDSEDMRATALSYLEIRLMASDAQGLSTTITRTVQPRRVYLTFASQPPGLALTLRGETVTTPRTVVAWVNSVVLVSAATQTSNGGTWQFVSWSDGGAAMHPITTPTGDATYTAIFSQVCSAPNLLLNPGFENGVADWVNLGYSGASTTPSNIYSGKRSLWVGTGAGGRRQSVTLQPSQTYELSGWGKLKRSNQQAWIRLRVNNLEYKVQVTTTSYRRYSLRLTMPASFTSKPSVSLWRSSALGDYLHFDQLELRRLCPGQAANQEPNDTEPVQRVEITDVAAQEESMAQRIQQAAVYALPDGSHLLTWSLQDATGITGFVPYRKTGEGELVLRSEVTDEMIVAESTTYSIVDAETVLAGTVSYSLVILGEDGTTVEVELGTVKTLENKIFLPLVSQ